MNALDTLNLSKKNISPSKKKKSIINKLSINLGVSPITTSDDTDCEEMHDHGNSDRLNSSLTVPTANLPRPSHLDKPKKVINRLCSSLNKSKHFETDENDILEDIYEDNEEDSGYFREASLGSFIIYKSKPKQSVHLRPLETFIYNPPFRVKKEELSKAGYWKDWEAKFNRNVDFTSEEIEEDMINKIESVIEYFATFDSSEYISTEENSPDATQKINLNAPYLPTPSDLMALQSLQIKVNSSRRILKDPPTTYCSDRVARLTTSKHGMFSRRESDTMMSNWENFKKEYKFYDLRPLLGKRTFLLEGNAERFTYSKVHYLTYEQHLAFIMYLGQGLENRSIVQLYIHAVCFLIGQVSTNTSIYQSMTTHELHLMDHFLKKYGLDVQLMEFLLHSKSSHQLARTVYRYYRYKCCPINSGPWTSAEILRLLDAIAHYSLDPAGMQRTALPGVYKSPINWLKVMEKVQTRNPDHCGAMFHDVLKQALKSRFYSNKKMDDVQWTANHELLLIKELCKTSEDSLARVNFFQLSTREDFAPFCDDFLKRVAREIIQSRVPIDKRRYFDDCLDYLAKKVLPVLSQKIEEHDEVFNTQYLSKANDILRVFPDYVNKYVIKMFSRLPLEETTDIAEASQPIDELENEGTDCIFPINSPTDADVSDGFDSPSHANTLARERTGGRLDAANKRERQHKLNSTSSKRFKKRKLKKQLVKYDDVSFLSRRVSTRSPLDIIIVE